MPERRRGRKPRVSGSPSDRRVELRLTRDEHRELEAVALENRKSVAALLRDAVNEFVSDYRERLLFG